MKVKLVIEYNGNAFCGWQIQINQISIQGVLTDAVRIFLSSQFKKNGLRSVDTSQSIQVQGSGRTDAGVHALGQVAAFSWPDVLAFDPYVCVTSLNGILHQSIKVISAELVDDSFHPRISAKQKTYLYKILYRLAPPAIEFGMVWHIRKLDNIDAMVRACEIFNGTHDFDHFRASDCNAKTSIRRVLDNSFTIHGNSIQYAITGNGFLKHQVRFMLGGLIAVGKNRITAGDLHEILEKKRKFNFEIAPAAGLYLKDVRY